MSHLLTKVATDDGDFIVSTDSTRFFLFSYPRTSVMPYRTKDFIGTPGFQVQYNTVEPSILREWHEMLCVLIGKGLFRSLSDGTEVGFFPYPDGKEHLQQYVRRFR